MRPSAWVILMVIVLVALVCRSHSATARSSSKPAQQKTSAPAAAASIPEWEVEGKWMRTQDEAIESALERAQIDLSTHLRKQNSRFEYVPPTVFIRENLLQDLSLPEDAPASIRRVQRDGHFLLEEERTFEDPVGKMRRVKLKVALNAEHQATLRKLNDEHLKQQRQGVAQERQTLLAKGLAVVVALLGTLVVYFRLEEATKGYYTAWLRVAAVGLIAAVVAGLLLVA